MEELLNKLIERWWKPRWIEPKRFDGELYYAEFFEYYNNWTMLYDGEEYSIRELCAKDSWLWQFVCENRLLKWPDATDDWQKNCDYTWLYDELFYASQYQYYLIESALCDEDKLEQFLLDNIEVEWLSEK
jgi:hypothetical protein